MSIGCAAAAHSRRRLGWRAGVVALLCAVVARHLVRQDVLAVIGLEHAVGCDNLMQRGERNAHTEISAGPSSAAGGKPVGVRCLGLAEQARWRLRSCDWKAKRIGMYRCRRTGARNGRESGGWEAQESFRRNQQPPLAREPPRGRLKRARRPPRREQRHSRGAASSAERPERGRQGSRRGTRPASTPRVSDRPFFGILIATQR